MKTEAEIKFDEMAKKYRDKFKKNYPAMITTSMTFEDMIKDIENCIRKGVPKKDFKYKRGADY